MSNSAGALRDSGVESRSSSEPDEAETGRTGGSGEKQLPRCHLCRWSKITMDTASSMAKYLKSNELSDGTIK